MNVRNRVFDILLVVVILSAAGYIGYRYFVSSRSAGSPVAVGTGAAVVATAPSVNLEREAQRPAHPQWLLVKVLPVEAEKYQEVLKKYAGVLVEKDETAGCSTDPLPTPAVSLLDEVVAERVKKGELQFLFGFKQPRCYKKGQKLSVLYYANSESEPFVTALGEVTVESVVENEPTQMPDELLKEMGITREEYNDFVGFRRPEGLKDMVIKFGGLRPVKLAEGVTPPGFPRAEVVTSAEVQRLVKNLPNLRVLDVRSSEEFHAGHLQVGQVKNVPFVLPGTVSQEFNWNVLNREVLKSSFDAMSIGQGIAPVLVYGASEKDSRPVYAMADLIRLGYRQIFWLREGYQAK